MSELLRMDKLVKHFRSSGGGGVIRAVNGVSLAQSKGETLGLVGESGCGKSTLGRLALRLIEPTSGDIHFDGADLRALSPSQLRRRRRDMQLIFQDPFASLDSRMKVSAIVGEPLEIHAIGNRRSRAAEVARLLELVGLPPEAASLYPHEFSGGQRQRIGIARAVALAPKLIVADEPVSALDVSIQAQILNLLVDLKARLGLAYLFISHDLAVIRYISDRVAVMYLGRIVELASVEQIFERPAHPYTQALIAAIPQPDPDRPTQRNVIRGDPPSPENLPTGCPFHPRCPQATESCRTREPVERDIGGPGAPHLVSCHLYAVEATR